MLTHESRLGDSETQISTVPSSSQARSPACDLLEADPTVLIVDDDPDIAPLVNIALRPFGVPTESVANGADALRLLGERTYHLVILDLAMGDLHGFDVLRALRNEPMNKRLPVLILSGNATHEALARSFGYGADEFVKKPFDICELGMRAFRLIRPFAQG
jgi:DNA-binding response OmpR family regulator